MTEPITKKQALSFAYGLDPHSTTRPDMPRPGDFFLTHRKDNPWFPPIAGAIRFGQRMKYRGMDNRNPEFPVPMRDYAYWNHAGGFVEGDPGTMVEALGRGVVSRNISVYKPTEFTIVYLEMLNADRKQVSDFWLGQVGAEYGKLVIANIAARLLVPGRLNYSIEGQWICSGMVAAGVRAAGYWWKNYVPERMMPADLAYEWKVRRPRLPL